MGFLDRLLGREEPQDPTAAYQANQTRTTPRPQRSADQRSDDEIAVERYQYLLKTAPPETIEKVHTEAFAKLTPQQRDILFQKLTENADASERPADAQPETLAKAATRQELQQPGTMTRAFGGGYGGGPSFGSMVGSSILGTVAGYVIGSALVSTFFPSDFGTSAADAGTDGSGADTSNADTSTTDGSDASADTASADTSYADGGYDSSGWGGDGGFDGGGDFGGDFGF